MRSSRLVRAVYQSLGILVLTAGTSGVQADGNLANGDSDTDSIATIGTWITGRFFASAGETLYVQVAELTGSGFEPRINLYDTNNTLLSTNTGTFSTDVSGVATIAGTYRAEVLDQGDDGTGDYRIYLATTASSFLVPAGDEGGTLDNGDIASGVIDLADLDLWRFTAEEAGTVHIHIGEVTDNGNFDPQIRLFDPFGRLITSNEGNTAADILAVLPVAGDYTVLVSEGSTDVPSTGSYNLFLVKTGEDFMVPAADEGGALTAGDIHSGTITLGDIDAWTFAVSDAETVLLQLGEVTDNGNFDPELRLYDSFGQLIADNSGSRATDLLVALTVAGKYTVVVLEQTVDIPSTGSYNLYYTSTGSSNVVPVGDEAGL